MTGAGRVIAEIAADSLGIQGTQFNSRRPEGYLGTSLRPDSVPILLGTAGYYYLLTGPQCVADPADRRAPHFFGDLIEPVQDGQDQPRSEQGSSLAWLGPANRRRTGQSWVVDQDLSGQPAPEILSSRVPRRY